MYKLTRTNGTDFYSGTVNYAENIGKKIIIPDAQGNDECGSGIHACKNPLHPFKYNAVVPCRAFEVKGIGLLCHSSDKSRYRGVEVISEIHDLNSLFGFNYTEAANPIHPFRLPPVEIVTDEHKALLKEWDSVWDSVWASVRDSVRDSVWASVWDSVGDSVWASVWDSVRDSVRASVRDSVRDSVWASVGDSVWASVWDSVGASVWASVWAYIGSLFPGIKKWKHIKHAPGTYPFDSAVKLWKASLVPSFNGTTWRLHTGEDAHVVYEWAVK